MVKLAIPDSLLQELRATVSVACRELVFTRKEADDLVRALWDAGYGITSVDAQGESGPVKVIFSVAKRKKLADILAIIS